LIRVADEFGCHALTLDHLAQVLITYFDEPRMTRELPQIEAISSSVFDEMQGKRLARIFQFYETRMPVRN